MRVRRMRRVSAAGCHAAGATCSLPQQAPLPRPRLALCRQPVQACSRGDRLGICVTQLDSTLVERGLACAPGGP